MYTPIDLAGGKWTVEELRSEFDAVKGAIKELDAEYADRSMDADGQARLVAYREHRISLDAAIKEREARAALIASLDDEEHAAPAVAPPSKTRSLNRSRIPEDIWDTSEYRMRATSDEDYGSLLVSGARRAVDDVVYPHPSADKPTIQADLERLLQTIDDPVVLSKRILATGSPVYQRAFGKMWTGQSLLPEEQRAAVSIVGGTAGFAAPFNLDPTIILTSNGAINPLRRICRVERITGRAWQGITSAGVTVSRKLEGAVDEGQAPTLAQPEVATVRVSGFVPYSIESGLVWSSLQSDVARMLQDAKDEEEADSFINGDGADEEPGGLIETMAIGSVIASGDTSFDVDDIYELKNALPPRWRSRARFLAESSIYDLVRQFDEAGGSSLWVQLQDDRPPRLIGYPAEEISTMPATATDQDTPLLFGDFQQFIIVDRVGMNVELIPHLFNQQTANSGFGRPTGQRGVYAHWHNNSEILVPGAFRLLKIGAS